MGGDFTRRQTTLGSLGILASLAMTAFGLPWIDSQLGGTRPWRDGVPYLVGCGVKITPPSGVALDISYSRPGKTSAQARFVAEKTRLVYTIRVTSFNGSLTGARERFWRRLARVGKVRSEGEDVAVYSGAGIPGVKGMFLADGGDTAGRYAVFLIAATSFAVEVVAVGKLEYLASAATDIDETFNSITVWWA